MDPSGLSILLIRAGPGVWLLPWPAHFMLFRPRCPHHGPACRPMVIHSSVQWVTPNVLLKHIASDCPYVPCHWSHLRLLYPGFNFLPMSISFLFTEPRALFLSGDYFPFPSKGCNICCSQGCSWTHCPGSSQGCVAASLGTSLFSSHLEFPLVSASSESTFS